MRISLLFLCYLLTGYCDDNIHFLCSKNIVNHSPTYDSVYLQLAALDFDYYLQKPIDSFIAHIPSGYTYIKIVSKGRRSHAGFMAIRYPNNIVLWLYVRGYQYMNPEDPNHLGYHFIQERKFT